MLTEFIRGESPFVQLQNPVFVQLYKCLLQMNLICTAVHHSGAPAAHISGTVGSNIRKYPTAHPGSCRFSPPAPPTRPPTAPGHTAPGTATPFTVSAQLQGLGDGLAATGIGPAPDTPVRPETSWPFPPWGSTDNDPDPVSRAQPSPPSPPLSLFTPVLFQPPRSPS